jgi:hypothetical protein
MQTLAQHMVERAQAHRANRNPSQPLGLSWAKLVASHGAPVPPNGQHSDRPPASPDGKVKYLARWTIEPLDIVDGEQYWRSRRQGIKQREESCCHGPRIWSWNRRIGAQKRSVERALLDRRQLVNVLVANVRQQIREASVAQGDIRLDWPAQKQGETALGRQVNASPQDRRLAYPCFTRDEQDRWAFVDVVE